jgi:hypothetical protein
LKQQFTIRKGFFDKLGKTLDKVLQTHQLQPESSKKPYGWDSPNSELEVSELVYTLHILAARIRMNEKAGGTFAKFKRDFFGLFGLDDKVYNKKVDTIKERKINDHFLNEMARILNDHHAKL